MKNIIYLFLISSVLCFTSCEDWLDVNDNPNAINEINPEYLFGYAVTYWSGNRCGGDSYFPIAFMNQTLSSGGGFGWGYGEDRYYLSSFTENTWKMYYTVSGSNLKEAIQIAEEQDKPNIAAQCKIAFATMFYECTMIWGDVPYSQAWSSVSDPKFDSQESILNNLIALLDEAIDQINEDDPKRIITEDAYYNGDLTKWKKMANSMKLKIAMSMYDADNSKSELIGELISSELIEMEDNFTFPYYDESGHFNPKYRILDLYSGGKNVWLFANTIILDEMMKPLNDPRIPIYFEPGVDAVEGEDYYAGVAAASEANSTISKLRVGTILKAEASDLILTSQEIQFYIAEAYLRGIGVNKDLNKANEYFKEALNEAFSFYDVNETSTASFINDPRLQLNTASNALEILRIQQYIDLQDRPLDAWIQMRRSGAKGEEIPLLSTPNGASVSSGEIARRWVYPEGELIANTNKPTNIPKIWEPLWFDK